MFCRKSISKNKGKHAERAARLLRYSMLLAAAGEWFDESRKTEMNKRSNTTRETPPGLAGRQRQARDEFPRKVTLKACKLVVATTGVVDQIRTGTTFQLTLLAV